MLFVFKFLCGETLFYCRGCGKSSICVSSFGKKFIKVWFPSCGTKLLDSERRCFHRWDQVCFYTIPIISVSPPSFWLSLVVTAILLVNSRFINVLPCHAIIEPLILNFLWLCFNSDPFGLSYNNQFILYFSTKKFYSLSLLSFWLSWH